MMIEMGHIEKVSDEYELRCLVADEDEPAECVVSCNGCLPVGSEELSVCLGVNR